MRWELELAASKQNVIRVITYSPAKKKKKKKHTIKPAFHLVTVWLQGVIVTKKCFYTCLALVNYVCKYL
jgi:hypothetical protein